MQNPSELEEESDMEDLVRPPRPITPTPSLLSQISTGSDMGRYNDAKLASFPGLRTAFVACSTKSSFRESLGMRQMQNSLN